MRSDRFVAMIRRNNGANREYLLVRRTHETLLEFPLIKGGEKESKKAAIKRTLYESLGLDVKESERIAVTFYQAPGVAGFLMQIYEVSVTNTPRASHQYESLAWMSASEIHEHISQMSYLMQEAILPCLDDDSACRR